MNKNRTIILFCYAHPDDESFGPGTAIAKYAEMTNVEVHLLCATRGEEGQLGTPPICSRAELGPVREQELLAAAEALGIKQVHFLSYRDKQLSLVSQQQLALEIRTLIYELGAQVVVTFAKHGISGHPDHQAIHLATHEAVGADPDTPVRKLYDQTIPTSLVSEIRIPHGDPDEQITTRIVAPEYIPHVYQALRAHKTQYDVIERVFPGFKEGRTDSLFTTSWYILCWTSPDVQHTAAESDLLSFL